MDAPKVVVSSHAIGDVETGTPRSRRSSSTANVAVETRSTRSSSVASDNASQKRKPSMSNPYFQPSARRFSSNFNNKSAFNESIESPLKIREFSKQQYQPTYRTEPTAHKRFVPHMVKSIMDSTLEEALEGLESYEAAKCRALSVSVCEDIKQKVKWLNYDRYKLVCIVYFGSVNGQEVRVASRCLWNDSSDNFATSSIVKGDVYAVALMYGVYTD